MSEHYHYQAFGLKIESDRLLPELPVSDHLGNQSDLILKSIKQTLPEQNLCSGSRQHFTLAFNNLSYFEIEEGKSIRYTFSKDTPSSLQRLFLLGSAMGAILQQRGFITLHANALQTGKDDATVFVADSGVGKSSLAAEHYLKGTPLISDDVCAIKQNEDGHFLVYPSYPQIKLWADSIERLGIKRDKLTPLRTSSNGQKIKYGLNCKAQFCFSPKRIDKIIKLDTQTKEHKGVEKIKLLIEQSYRYRFIEMMGLVEDYIQKLILLSQQTSIQSIKMAHIATMA